MRRLSLLALALFLAGPAPAALVELGGELATPVMRTASLSVDATRSLPTLQSLELAPSRELALSLDAQVRAGVAAATVAEAAKLTTLTEHVTFADASGAKLVLVPFDGKAMPHLSQDSLAEADPEDKLVFANWSLAGGDRYALERAGLKPSEAQRATALGLAPALGHELRHVKLHADAGFDLPGTREEELVTHVDQALAHDEVLRKNPDLKALRRLLERTFLFPHNEALIGPWSRGFGAFADFVLRKNDALPSIAEREKNLAGARYWSEKWGPDAPLIWRDRVARAISFWSDPAQVKRARDFLQAQIDDAYARWRGR